MLGPGYASICAVKMDDYRRVQADKWKKKKPPQRTVQAEILVDSTSLDSISTFLAKTTSGKILRSGILYGTIENINGSEESSSSSTEEIKRRIVVDAIYESAQDTNTGEPLYDCRSDMIQNISALMGLRPVGILVGGSGCVSPQSQSLCRAANLMGAIAHIILFIENLGETKGFILEAKCLEYVRTGRLTPSTTLKGPTVNGGLDGSTLYSSIEVTRRQINQVVHTGFYRLNRPDHTPTLEDVRAYIIARRDHANIPELHNQLADYHLLLFIADMLGESSAERAILAIFQEEDELVEDLIETLLNWRNDAQ